MATGLIEDADHLIYLHLGIASRLSYYCNLFSNVLVTQNYYLVASTKSDDSPRIAVYKFGIY